MREPGIFASIFCSVLVLMLSIAVTQSRAQNSINGIVFDADRKPVPKIDVELLDEFERFIRSTQTSGSGLYFFQGLRQGNYYVQVRVDGTGYQPAKERIQLGQGNRTTSTGQSSGGETAQINFTLIPRKQQSEKENQAVNGVIFAQEVPQSAREAFARGSRLLEDKKIKEGIAEIEASLSIYPDYYLALDRLGFLFLDQADFRAAENTFTHELAVNPKSLSARSGLGVAQFKLGKMAEAAATLEQVVVDNPSSVSSFVLLGKVYRELKQNEKAETTFKKADKLSDGKSPDVHWELALLYYYNLKRLNEAADELDRFLKASPDSANRVQIQKLAKQFRTEAKQKN